MRTQAAARVSWAVASSLFAPIQLTAVAMTMTVWHRSTSHAISSADLFIQFCTTKLDCLDLESERVVVNSLSKSLVRHMHVCRSLTAIQNRPKQRLLYNYTALLVVIYSLYTPLPSETIVFLSRLCIVLSRLMSN